MTVEHERWIGVPCNDGSHEGKTVKVAGFTHTVWEADGEVPERRQWLRDDPVKVNAWGHREWGSRQPDAEVRLEGDRPVPHTESEWTPWSNGPTPRTRHTLECRLCGLKIDIRDERLEPILDRLAEADVEYVELAHLAGIVS